MTSQKWSKKECSSRARRNKNDTGFGEETVETEGMLVGEGEGEGWEGMTQYHRMVLNNN